MSRLLLYAVLLTPSRFFNTLCTLRNSKDGRQKTISVNCRFQLLIQKRKYEMNTIQKPKIPKELP
ncbi:hypothetical protein, partial [Paenibacillus polymyxa]|uniref:hypothetical protein n=1 Tax=Paenibacillus polymyxa TaxID=1406 RepID=UPI001C4011A1